MIESGLERMKAVAEMLGVELDEEFEILCHPLNPHKITELGLFNRGGRNRNDLLACIITGEVLITKRPKVPAEPWEPKEGEFYWYVVPNGIVKAMTFHPSMSDMDAINYRIGNCFADCNTAEANRDIILQKFNAPELIPASWTPEYREVYWYACNGVPCSGFWGATELEYSLKAVGNIYRTRAEAEGDYPNLRKRLGMPEDEAYEC